MPDRHTTNGGDMTHFQGMRAFRTATYTRRPTIDGFPARADAVVNKQSVQHEMVMSKTSTHAATHSQYVSRSVPTAQPRDVQHTQPALPRQKHSIVLHRSSFGAKMARKTRPKLRRQPLLRNHYSLSGMLFALLLCGTGVGVNAWHISRIAKNQNAVLAKTTDSSVADAVPSEELEAASSAGYRVSPDLPRMLTIPKLQVDARVQRAGLNVDHSLRAPSNIFEAGWYDRSAKPGESGTIVIDGHVSGPTKRGVFYSLDTLEQNDEITLERGDGTIFHYKVVKQDTYEYDNVDMQALLSSAVPGKPGLNLITASGRFDIRTNKFERRTVIFAVLAN